MEIRRAATIGLCLLLIGGLAGCNLVENPQPSSARARLTSSGGSPVTLIVSKVFLAQYQQTLSGRRQVVRIFDADTTFGISSFDQSFDIEREQRFLVQIPIPDTLDADLRLEAWIDGEREYNRVAAPEDSVLQFIYVYQGSNPPADGGRL